MNPKELLLQLVSIPSVTDSAEESEPLVVIERFLQQHGVSDIEIIEHSEHKRSLVARIGSGEPLLLFNSHIDVVPAVSQLFEPQINNGVVYARGAADAKGPLYAMLHAFIQLAESNPSRQIILCCVADEENAGTQGSKQLFDQHSIEAPYVIVGEPTGMKPIIAEKGFLRFTIDVRGKAAHAAFPKMGSNALIDAAAIVEAIEAHDWKVDHPLLGKPTVVPAMMQAGNKINVIPEHASVSFDMRFLPSQSIPLIMEEIRSICAPFEATVSMLESGEAFEIAADARLSAIASQATNESPIGIAFGTDARFYANSERIVLGPGDPNVAHTEEEHIALSAIDSAISIYLQIARKILDS